MNGRRICEVEHNDMTISNLIDKVCKAPLNDPTEQQNSAVPIYAKPYLMTTR